MASTLDPKYAKLGLPDSILSQLAKKEALKAVFDECLDVVEGEEPSSSTANLLFIAASTLKPRCASLRPLLAKYIVDDQLKESNQVQAAIKYLQACGADAPEDVDVAAFELACGAGVVVSDEEIDAFAASTMARLGDRLRAERYVVDLNREVFVAARADARLKWGFGRVKAAVDAAVEELLGPKTDEDDAKIKAARANGKKKKNKGGDEGAAKGGAGAGAGGDGKGKKGTGNGKAAAAAAAGTGAGTGADEDEEPEPIETLKAAFEARDLESAKNSKELQAAHLEETKGRMRTRFPPEPNGYLHIGHAKSMNLNFDMAFRMLGSTPEEGDTIFRYDDTNPEAESHEFIDNQGENVRWMGWKPFRVTFSSDYFDTLYELAERLIREGKAYVCHQTAADMEASREHIRHKTGDPNSPWRERSVEDNMKEFRRMRDGCYDTGAATLRLKMDMSSPNPSMWDPVAYRIKYVAHPRTGDKWCIYPSYDFTHCIVDSLEHIDYSLCTLEFEAKRDSYYWLLEQLDMWRPKVWEFSRLNITNNVMSKRKILKLVMENTVRGWDDPRLFTINGLRRRGYTPTAINEFCRGVGVTRQQNLIRLDRLESYVRAELNETAPRAFAVVKPLRVVLTNVGGDGVTVLEAPLFPANPEAGTRSLPLTRVIYIEKDDFRLVDSKSFFGLVPGGSKKVGLRYGGLVSCDEVVYKDGAGAASGSADRTASVDDIAEIRCTYMAERDVKPKGNLHWVGDPDAAGAAAASGSGDSGVGGPVWAEIRLYSPLFDVHEPGKRTGNWLDDLDADSEEVCNGIVEPSAARPGAYDRYQFERLGFFVQDKESMEEKPVFNRVVTLKSSAAAQRATKGARR